MNISDLRSSGVRALLGIVTPNLRAVSIMEKDALISLYFYYDSEPSELEEELSEEAATTVIADFPEPFMISCRRETVQFPKKVEFRGHLIFLRYEKFLEGGS